MARIVFVNGEFVSEDEAKISIFDRGFLFADAVYEVTSILDGKLVDWQGHFERLKRSLRELNITIDFSEKYLLDLHRKIINKNKLNEGIVYLQVTRGAADRDFVFENTLKPSLIIFSQSKEIIKPLLVNKGLLVMTSQDIRWQRPDIKTTQLLAPSLLKMEALSKSMDDVWMVKDNLITEGTSNNAFIVDSVGKIITRNLSHDILGGITRAVILKVAKESGLEIEERSFTLEECYSASEAFITSSSIFIRSVVRINGKLIGKGKPGEIVGSLISAHLEYCKSHLT